MTQAEAVAGAQQTLADLRTLEAKKARLLAELDRSLALMSLCPEMFTHGAVKSAWTGVPKRRDMRGTLYALRLRVTDGAGTVREFPQTDVPPLLWPAPVAGRLP